LFSIVLVTLALLLPISAKSADVIVDNRLHVPVGILTEAGVEWYPTGERKTILPEAWYITSMQGTNGQYYAASDGELTRFVVMETDTNTIAGYVYPEHGFKGGFGRGLAYSLSAGLLFLVVIFVKRVLRAGGVYSE